MDTATISWIQAFKHSNVDLLNFISWEKGDLSDYECHMEFHTQSSLGFTENGQKKEKISSDGNSLYMKEARGEQLDWFKLIER